MNRYKFSEEQWGPAIKFIKNGEGHLDAPNWAVKHKPDLTVKGTTIFYKGLEIVPLQRIDAVLRAKIFDKKCEVGFARDSAFYTLSKSYIGLPRRKIMTFLRKQRTLGDTRPSVAQARRKAGPPLKVLTLETDLCFIRKADLVAATPRFEKTHEKDEVYCVTTIEKSSSLVQLSFSDTKEANIVTPIVLEHIKYFAKRFGKSTKEFDLESDKGGEFRHADIAKIVRKVKHVNTGVSVEKANQTFQQNFYRILRNRQSTSVRGAIKKAQKIMNNSFSSIHKKSPNDVVDQKEDSLKTYNNTRKSYISGSNRGELDVGQHVRLLIKKGKDSIGYKSYKNKTWSKEVYVVKKKTKTTTPTKYFVNRKWLLIDSLLKSAPRDKESDKLMETRTKQQDEADKKQDEADKKKRDAERIAEDKRKGLLRAAGKIMKVRDSSRIREKIERRRKEEAEKDKLIELAELQYQKYKGQKKKKPQYDAAGTRIDTKNLKIRLRKKKVKVKKPQYDAAGTRIDTKNLKISLRVKK